MFRPDYAPVRGSLTCSYGRCGPPVRVPAIGRPGVRGTGSDISVHSLFGSLQAKTAHAAGPDANLLATANSSGGVIGEMLSSQYLAIAAAAAGLQGKEGGPFHSALGWSLLPLLLICIPVYLQATPVLSWMVV
ncbi:L-lactate permease [Rhodococcus opacus]|uniref:L-lactate permease n=1 Tax=Rhodococcus opacus TaxID=37919 RepID=UPI00211E228A|nr:L-lactate permease [Rhodococcus opacus]